MIYNLFVQQLKALQLLLQNLHDHQYTLKSALLGNASIGQHTRHTIELAQALVSGYEAGEVNYDKRKRDAAIEKDTALAYSKLTELLTGMNLQNKDVLLVVTDNSTGEVTKVQSNYFRELVYNYEHTIHHMALIRVALREMKLELVDDNFGVAPSTLKYRQTMQ